MRNLKNVGREQFRTRVALLQIYLAQEAYLLRAPLPESKSMCWKYGRSIEPPLGFMSHMGYPA